MRTAAESIVVLAPYLVSRRHPCDLRARGTRCHGVLEERFRAPHILSLGFPDGMPSNLVPALAAQHIYVAPRLGRMRVSPHVYNDEADIDRFVAAVKSAVS